MVGQHLLVQIDEPFAAALVDEGVQNAGVAIERVIDGVIGRRLDRDQTRFLGRATAHIHIDLIVRKVSAGVQNEQVGGVGRHAIQVEVAEIQVVRVDDSEAAGAIDQGGEADAQLGPILERCRSRHIEARRRAVVAVNADDQTPVAADRQIGNVHHGRLAEIQRSI